MSKQIFNEEEIKVLSENPYVLKASNKSISYTNEFILFNDKNVAPYSGK